MDFELKSFQNFFFKIESCACAFSLDTNLLICVGELVLNISDVEYGFAIP